MQRAADTQKQKGPSRAPR